MRSDGSGVDTAVFAPNRLRLPIRRRGSPGACGNRSWWTVSRCRPRMRPSATASVGGKPVEGSTCFCADGAASVRDAVLGISAPMRFTGKAQKFYTVLSDLVHGEVIGLATDRTEASLAGLLTTCLDPRQRAAVDAVCTDMHRPYVNAVAHQLPKAEIVFDKFHVLQHASAALDDVRRQEFFRAGAVMRTYGRGKRWLLLRRWKTVRGSKRRELEQLFAMNRRLFKAYVLREQLDRLWAYTTRWGVARFLLGWLNALRWQRLPEMEKLGGTLANHLEGIAAYCDHPVRFGVVESLNTTIKAVLRRARGMRDDAMLLLKLKWATAHPIRSARDLVRFLSSQGLYSNQ